MAETFRNHVGTGDVRHPTRASDGELRDEPQLNLPELPGFPSPTNSPALNRSAEVVGRSVGTAVAGVRSLPRRIDKLRSRIHLVSGREALAESALEVMESAAETAAHWRDEAEERITELHDEAGAYTYRAADRANRRLQELQRRTVRRIDVLRRNARELLADVRHWGSEQPLQAIGACTAAAFVLGVALRVWRSNSV